MLKEIKKKDNVLIIMSGVPGSGKSTYAKKLAEKEHIRICCMDDIREKLGSVNDQSRNKEVYGILMGAIKRELKKGNSVIVDNTSCSAKERTKYLNAFKGLYKESACVFFDIGAEEAKKRCQKRELKTGKIISDEVVDCFYNKLSPPTEEEGFTYVEVVR
jgi:predicted kinase